MQLLLLPKDAADEKNAILEVRAGTGGDKAALLQQSGPHVPAVCRTTQLEI